MGNPVGRPKKTLYFNRVEGKSFEQRVYRDIARGLTTPKQIQTKYGIPVRNGRSVFYRLLRKGCIRRVSRGNYEVSGPYPDDQRGCSIGSQQSLMRWKRVRVVAVKAPIYQSALMQAIHG